MDLDKMASNIVRQMAYVQKGGLTIHDTILAALEKAVAEERLAVVKWLATIHRGMSKECRKEFWPTWLHEIERGDHQC